MNPATVPDITPTELKARLDKGDVPTLVDVREAFEVEIADLPDHGQVLIPTGQFFTRADELDAEQEIVVYCRTGNRSEWAARILMERGFKQVWNLKGGVMAWREEVDPSLQRY